MTHISAEFSPIVLNKSSPTVYRDTTCDIRQAADAIHSMIHLDLQPETEAQLTAEAQARGLALDRYIESIVEARLVDPITTHTLDEEQLARDLQQGLREIAEGNTLPARKVFAQLREEYDIRG